MKTLAERLANARTQKKWTQAQLASAAEVSTGTIGNIESGLRGLNKPMGTLPAIARALGVTYEWLAHGTEPMMIGGQREVNADKTELSSLQIATIEGLTRALKNGAFSDKDCLDLLQRLIN